LVVYDSYGLTRQACLTFPSHTPEPLTSEMFCAKSSNVETVTRYFSAEFYRS
jgi:hypothetical protein